MSNYAEDASPLRQSIAHQLSEVGLIKEKCCPKQEEQRNKQWLCGPGVRAICVAYSGGADSLATLHEAAQVCVQHKIACHAITVNHNLAQGSSHRATLALSQAKKIQGVIPHVHNITIASGAKDIEQRARRARYASILAFCRASGIPVLLTGHHSQDEAESLFMRITMGFGLKGLAGIRPISTMGGICILRPALNSTKQQLQKIAQSSGLTIVEDPTNNNQQFATRNAIHKQLNLCKKQDAIQASIASLKAERSLLEGIIAERLASISQSSELGYYALNAEGLNGINQILAEHIVQSALVKVFPQTNIRRSSIQRLTVNAQNQNGCTFGGVQIFHTNLLDNGRAIIFCREPSRPSKQPQEVPLAPKSSAYPLPEVSSILWDDRLKISIVRPTADDKKGHITTPTNSNEEVAAQLSIVTSITVTPLSAHKGDKGLLQAIRYGAAKTCPLFQAMQRSAQNKAIASLPCITLHTAQGHIVLQPQSRVIFCTLPPPQSSYIAQAIFQPESITEIPTECGWAGGLTNSQSPDYNWRMVTSRINN